LSEFAGAASQMTDALIINPFSRESAVDAILRALSMPQAERRRRWEGLMQGVKRDDVVAWRDAFVSELRRKDVRIVAA
jgi:trehalose 6-phosphate synthase